MIAIIGTVRVAADAIERARAAMATMIAASRAEDGCIAYSYALDVLDPTLVHVVERWRDRAALEAHFRTDHIAAWRAGWRDLGIGERDLMLYDIDAGSPV